MTDGATKRPWRTPGFGELVDANGRPVGFMTSIYGHAQAEQTAKEVVHAVNNFDALVAALEQAEKNLVSIQIALESPGLNRAALSHIDAGLVSIRSALAARREG